MLYGKFRQLAQSYCGNLNNIQRLFKGVFNPSIEGRAPLLLQNGIIRRNLSPGMEESL